MKKITTIKLLAIGVVVMGFVHIAATFSPMIADKLAPLSEGMQRACIYFSLMCGAMLILGGSIVHMQKLATKIFEKMSLFPRFFSTNPAHLH